MPAKTEKKKKKCNSVKKVKSTVKSEVKFGVKSKVIKISEKTGSKRNVSKKKVKRIQYAPEDLKKAVLDVEKGMSYRKTSNKYGVPVTSIHRAMKNQDQASKKSGPPTVLSPNEESDIVQWILYRAERGYPISKTELLDAVRKYVTLLDKKTPFTNRRPGRRWYESFRKRHNNISLRTPQHLTLTRASVTEEDLRDWFREIEEYLRKKGLIDIQPSRVFNCDETNMQLIPKSEKVLTEIGARSAYKIVDGFEKESVTALFMYSADGSRAPPMLMFKYKDSVPKSISKNCPVDWGIGISENGWMTTETFYEYIANIFYPWLLKENIEFPVIIYLDGHSSHVTIPLVKFCRENRIELIALFPNATHILQPLDIALFHPFKDLWRKTVLKWKAENNQSRLKKEHVSKVLAETLACFTNEKKIIQGGFQAAGLMPFNPNAIEYNILNKKKKKKVKKQEDEPESQQAVTVAQTETKSQHMQNLEQNLPHELLQAFREAEQIGFWTRDVENIGLFNYWFKQKQATSANKIVKTNPTIKNIQCFNNHKVIVLHDPLPPNVSVESCKNKSNDVIILEVDNNIEDVELNNILKDSSLSSIILEPNNVTNENIEEIEVPLTNETYLNVNNVASVNSDESMPLHLENQINDKENIDSTLEVNANPTIISSSLIFNTELPKLEKQINDRESYEAFQSPTIEMSHPVLQENFQRSTKTVNKESDITQTDDENQENQNPDKTDNKNEASFSMAFTLPVEYLPKKKRIKLEGKGKSKLPSVGTSDMWWNTEMKKEQAKKEKQERILKNKQLREEKKKIAEEKKKLQEKMKEIAKKIKIEKL